MICPDGRAGRGDGIMTIKHMRIFLMVCECGNNISEAARKLYTTQPSVTIAIQEIERYYGVLLFDRISRRLYLTETGKKFQSYAMRILTLFDDMEKEMKDWDSFGTVRVGASITIGSQFMPGYAQVFGTVHPGAKMQVLIGPSQMLEQKLMINELDLALVETPVHELPLAAEPYMDDELAVISPARAPYAPDKVLTVEEFQKQRLLLREHGSGTRELFEQTMQQAGISIAPAWEATSTTALVNAVVRGIGIAVVPLRMVQASLDQGLVYSVQVEGIQFRRKFYIVCHQDKNRTKLIQDFIEIVKQGQL